MVNVKLKNFLYNLTFFLLNQFDFKRADFKLNEVMKYLRIYKINTFVL